MNTALYEFKGAEREALESIARLKLLMEAWKTMAISALLVAAFFLTLAIVAQLNYSRLLDEQAREFNESSERWFENYYNQIIGE